MVEAGADARLIVDADVFVADGVAVDRANAEGDRTTVLPPHEIAHLVGHRAAELHEKLGRELLEVHRRFFVDLQIERIELVDLRFDVGRDGQLDRIGRVDRLELAAQVFPGGGTELLRQVFVE